MNNFNDILSFLQNFLTNKQNTQANQFQQALNLKREQSPASQDFIQSLTSKWGPKTPAIQFIPASESGIPSM